MVLRTYLDADVFDLHRYYLGSGMVQDTVFLFLACRNLCLGHGNACGHQCFLCRHQAQAEDKRYLLCHMFDQVLHFHFDHALVLLSGMEHDLKRSAVLVRDHYVELSFRKIRNIGKGIRV